MAVVRDIYQPLRKRTWAQRALSAVPYLGFVATTVAFVLAVQSAASAEWARATFSLLLAYLLLDASTVLKEQGSNR